MMITQEIDCLIPLLILGLGPIWAVENREPSLSAEVTSCLRHCNLREGMGSLRSVERLELSSRPRRQR